MNKNSITPHQTKKTPRGVGNRELELMLGGIAKLIRSRHQRSAIFLLGETIERLSKTSKPSDSAYLA